MDSILHEASRSPRHPWYSRWGPRASEPPLWLGAVVAAALICAETLAVEALSRVAPNNTFGIVFMVGVLVVSAVWGFKLAVLTTLVSALAYLQVHVDGAGLPSDFHEAVPVAVFLPVALIANVLGQQIRLRAREAEDGRRKATAALDRVRELVEQQAGLRRIATQIAEGRPPSEVLACVADEVATVLRVSNVTLLRYEADGSAVIVAARDEVGRKTLPVGTRLNLEGDNVAALVRTTGNAARMDSHEHARGPAAAFIRDLGLKSGVGVPIVVDGRLWGAAVVGSAHSDPLASDTEARLTDFAALVGTAIANADARTELIASRARIVTAADDARRRIERDLHDGAQQRLVALGLRVRAVEALVPPTLDVLRRDIAGIGDGLGAACEELREIAHGLHPAVLSRGGLRPALRGLGRRAAMPVEVNVDLESRLPESVEVAAYYLVAEALTNAAKHANASVVTVEVTADPQRLRVAVSDDGVGGTDVGGGTGLIGLKDRVEALGGRLHVASDAGVGTTLVAEIPFTGT